MSHALVPDKWTRPCSAKSGPRSSVLVKGLGARFRGYFGLPRTRQLPSHVVVMQHTVSDVIHNQCGHTAML
jgi:hypothetical protein